MVVLWGDDAPPECRERAQAYRDSAHLDERRGRVEQEQEPNEDPVVVRPGARRSQRQTGDALNASPICETTCFAASSNLSARPRPLAKTPSKSMGNRRVGTSI